MHELNKYQYNRLPKKNINNSNKNWKEKIRKIKEILFDTEFTDTYTQDKHDKDYKKIVIIIIFLSVIAIILLKLIELFIEQVAITLLICLYSYLLLFFRDIWVPKIIFLYKRRLLETYYDKLNNAADNIICSTEENHNIKWYFIFNSNNGKLIGFLESFFYTFAILGKEYSIIAFVIGLRSILTVTSHPNKEESEFFLIGIMGSLLYSIIINTFLIIGFYRIFNISIFEILENCFSPYFS